MAENTCLPVGLSVPITAEEPSGESRASVISVVFMNSSSVMAGAD